MATLEDLTGRRFGRLTAMELVPAFDKHGNKLTVWRCKCDCGNVKDIWAGSLKKGTTKSCGCLSRERSASTALDLTGQRFGRLTVIERDGSKWKKAQWKCLCDCGRYVSVVSRALVSGNTKSCGCLEREINGGRFFVHGHSHSHDRLYEIWKGMRARCYSENNTNYKHYGARGITICEEWDDYMAFRDWALKAGYDETAPRGQCTIERIDVNGNYCPENCKWATMREQMKNRRPPQRTKPRPR